MTSLALHTDLYQLTMANGFWETGLHHQEAVFHLFFRTLPFGGGFVVTAGLEAVVDYLARFRFEASDLEYLSTLRDGVDKPLLSEAFLEELARLRFTCDIDAIPEGSVVFPYEPLLRIQGPLIQCQLLETPLLNLINFPSLIATKAARLCFAAKGDSVVEFGARRAQGLDGALTASRAAYVGGCSATSNLLAGKRYGIPVSGTHSHSWVMVFDDELESFQKYAEAMPDNCLFLVDTYNTCAGVDKAIEVGRWLRSQGHRMLGVRLDSGDLTELSIESRRRLDAAGFEDALIIASNELDETVIAELKRQGACIAVWGVGTSLVTGKGESALDGVYKLSAIRDSEEAPWKYKIKLSEQMRKISNPGILQVRRFCRDGECLADAIYDIHTDVSDGVKIIDPFDATHQRQLTGDMEAEDLLLPIFRGGVCCYDLPPLEAIRERAALQLTRFSPAVKRFLNPHLYPVGLEQSLYELKIDLVKKIRNQGVDESNTPQS